MHEHLNYQKSRVHDKHV